MRDSYGDIIFSKMPTTALHKSNEKDIRRILEDITPVMYQQREWYRRSQLQAVPPVSIDRLKRKFR